MTLQSRRRVTEDDFRVIAQKLFPIRHKVVSYSRGCYLGFTEIIALLQVVVYNFNLNIHSFILINFIVVSSLSVLCFISILLHIHFFIIIPFAECNQWHQRLAFNIQFAQNDNSLSVRERESGFCVCLYMRDVNSSIIFLHVGINVQYFRPRRHFHHFFLLTFCMELAHTNELGILYILAKTNWRENLLK